MRDGLARRLDRSPPSRHDEIAARGSPLNETYQPPRGLLTKDEIMSEQITHVTDADFDNKVLGSHVPVLVDFWAPWCGPCRVVGPVMEELAETRGQAVKVYKVNVDESTKVASQMGIRSIPTVMLFDGGELQETIVGARPRAHFDKMLDDYLEVKSAGQA